MKQFQKNNLGFTCKHCGKEVPKHPKSSRNHCNQCLWGMHVDITPGDRMNDCKGQMKPVGLKVTGNKQSIIFECTKCNRRNICVTAPDDNFEELVKISKLKW